MNAYHYHGQAGRFLTNAIAKGLGIAYSNVLKVVKELHNGGVIETKDGKKYQLTLTEIKE